MPTKEAVRKELDSANNIYEILEVMKHMASSQYSTAKKQSEGVYIGMIETIGQQLLDTIISMKFGNLKDPFIEGGCPVVGVIAVTSDQAFMGALNTKVVKITRQVSAEFSEVQYLVTGRKGARKFKFNKDPFVPFPPLKDGPAIREVTDLVTNYIIEQVKANKLGKIFVVAAENLSFTKQQIIGKQVLPFRDICAKGDNDEKGSMEETYLESPLSSITEYLARLWLGSKLYAIFLSAKAAEFGALATQMESNLDNVKKVTKKLKTMYKKARNEKVDASMREIFVSTMVAGGG